MEWWKDLLNYGVLGILVVGLSFYILYLHKMYNKKLEKKDEIIKQTQDKSIEAINNNTNVLSSLKTLLEHWR